MKNPLKSISIKCKEIIKKIYANFFVIGLISICWYIIRTGVKPSRANYPCQKAAKINVNIWFTLYLFPIISFIKKKGKKPIIFLIAAILIISFTSPLLLEQIVPIRASPQDIVLALEEHNATNEPSSNLWVVTNTTGWDNGFLAIINLMGEHGTKFYKSDVTWENQGPDGLIANDDIIIIKVNCQWNQRGGTNTDLIKSIIEAIINHPDGFIGEIVVADNGQEQFGSDLDGDGGGSLNYTESNAEDHSQSIQDVVDQFSSSYNVSTYLWDIITETQVDEYSDSNMTDGFVVNTTRNPDTGVMVSYPKFQTIFGTYISFKKGIWDPDSSQYDSERLKIINVPVLKTHSDYGVTACVKHYMGVPSDKLTKALGARTHSTVDKGGMGTLMAETRMPILNILDAIWIRADPLGGPLNSYYHATRVNVTMVSTDPIALDYWASKYVLTQAASLDYSDLSSMDPDNTDLGSFGNWLNLSMAEINKAGYQTTNNMTKINVSIRNLRERPIIEFKEGWNLISIPLNPLNSSVDSIFSDKLDKIEGIFSYSNEKWDYWIPGVQSTITKLNCGQGYWVLTNDTFNITLSGDSNINQPLNQGWNLIGLNGTYPFITKEYLQGTNWTKICSFDEKTSQWQYYIRDIGGPVNIMQPGEGYWVETDTS